MVGAGNFHPQEIREALEANEALIKGAGYDFRALYIGPEDGVAPLVHELKSRHWDGVAIGFGVRGKQELTVWFESLVNTVVELSPQTKLLFNSSPSSTLDSARRNLPIRVVV
jgi:hypothetical protein